MDKSDDQNFLNYEIWVQLKLREFLRLGYGNISEKDLWTYFTTYRWKKGRPEHYHQAVSDIMQATPNDYFNYETLKAQVYEVKSIDQLDLDGLF